MMMKKKSNPWARMKYAYVLPLAALTMTAFARPEVSMVANEISSAKVTNFAAIAKANPSETAPKDSIYEVVDEMPEFPGGIKAQMEFMKNNLRYPEELKAKGTQGRVVVLFVVNKDGSLSDAKVIRKVDPLMDAEALRVINAMPRWKPGMQGGKPVAVKYTVPVLFRLDETELQMPSSGKVTYDEDKVLIVIDGVMKEGMKMSELNSVVRPDEISSITVLKDEKATQLYGAKGKYGVIAIVTKAAAQDAEGK